MNLRRCRGAFPAQIALALAACLAAASPALPDNAASAVGAQSFERETPLILGRSRLAPTRSMAQAMALHQDTGGPDREPDDLTELTLEQLMQLEITAINVLGSHTHFGGEWMIAYRYMAMDMGGYRDGTRRLTDREVLELFPTIHTSMFMNMHMLEVMYAPSDRLTLMTMFNYMDMSMDHLMRDGTRFTTHSSGLADTILMGLYTLTGDPRARGHRLLLNAGVSFPTGSINKRDDTPMASNVKLEYPMQLGSGTFDLLPGFTYLGESTDWAWGAQTLGTLRLGRNANGYRFGHQLRTTAWGSYKLTDWLAPSLRLDGRLWGNVRGSDPELNPGANPEANPNNQGGRRLDLLLGLNFFAPRGPLRGTRLSIEGGVPIYQSLSGPQIQTNWMISVGLSNTFR